METSDDVIEHGAVSYRRDQVGNRVTVLPETCYRGVHALGGSGYRATERGELLVISCVACVADGCGEHYWALRVSGPPTRYAELA